MKLKFEKKIIEKKEEKKEFCIIFFIIYIVYDNLSDLCGKVSEDI